MWQIINSKTNEVLKDDLTLAELNAFLRSDKYKYDFYRYKPLDGEGMCRKITSILEKFTPLERANRNIDIKVVDEVSMLGDITDKELLAQSEKYDKDNYNPLDNLEDKVILIPKRK